MRRALGIVVPLLASGFIVLASACGTGAMRPTQSPSPPQFAASPTRAPTPSSSLYLSLDSFYFVDVETGWLSARSCREEPHTPPSGPGSTPPPPVCEPGFYGTTDGGQTWSLLSNDGVGPFVMDGSGTGLAAGGFCEYSPCNSSVLRTTDGGRHWAEAYSSALWLTDLTFIDGEAWLLGNSCGYSDRDPCTRYLLKSTDGGVTWAQAELPVAGFGTSISRPTKHDAFIGSGNGREAGQLLSTHDGGATWASSPLPTSLFEGGVLFFRTPLEGWLLVGGVPGAGSQWKWLYATKDGGVSWTEIAASVFGTPEPGAGVIAYGGYVGPMFFASSQEGWIESSRAGIIRSRDGGKSWSISYFSDAPTSGMQFTDSLHGWLIPWHPHDAQPMLLNTSDGGVTWQKLPLPTPENP